MAFSGWRKTSINPTTYDQPTAGCLSCSPRSVPTAPAVTSLKPHHRPPKTLGQKSRFRAEWSHLRPSDSTTRTLHASETKNVLELTIDTRGAGPTPAGTHRNDTMILIAFENFERQEVLHNNTRMTLRAPKNGPISDEFLRPRHDDQLPNAAEDYYSGDVHGRCQFRLRRAGKKGR
jgi:hypothetical protein